jgi:hypothetical protein
MHSLHKKELRIKRTFCNKKEGGDEMKGIMKWTRVIGMVMACIGGGLWWQYIMSASVLCGVVATGLIVGGNYLVIIFPYHQPKV